jgi:hypothetical protein
MGAPTPHGAVARECAELIASAPPHVAGQARRSITPGTAFAAAWGNPPIELRCGGTEPRALRPTSQCFVVDGVGWLVTQDGKAVDPTKLLTGELGFATIGRSAYVELRVPGDYQPASDALVDLAGDIKQHTRVTQRCR